MASEEQIQTLCRELKKAAPSQMFQSIDASAAGMRAILLYLGEADKVVTAGMVSDFMHVSTARVAVLLKKMEAKGLIEKERDPKDARKVMVRLSAQGGECAAGLHGQISACVEAMIDQIGMERMLEFAAIADEIHSIFKPEKMDI